MKRLLTLCLALAGVAGLCSAQSSKTRVEVTFYTPSIVRIYKAPVDNHDSKQSLSVTMKPEQVKVAKTQEKLSDKVVLDVYKSDQLTVSVYEGSITFRDKKGNTILQEMAYNFGSVTQEKPSYADVNVKQTFSIDEDEPVYGLGILQEGRMDLRGTNRRMIQGNTDDYCNIIQSIKGYGVFWDNYSPTTFVANDNGFQFISDNGGCIDYYFIWGGDADGVIAGIRQLTGTVPMQPLWSYGFMQSRERYKSSSELTNVLDRYREDGVPIDVMIQDWQYWGDNYLWNAMEFNNPDFSNPERWIKHIHALAAYLL